MAEKIDLKSSPEKGQAEENSVGSTQQHPTISSANPKAESGTSLHRLSHATPTSEHLPPTANTHSPQQVGFDPQPAVTLPYRTLNSTANIDEYVTEAPSGEIDGPPENDGSGRRYKLVTFLPDDPENPKNWSKAFKWYVTMVVALTCFVVALASSVITADIAGVVEEFGVSEEVALLSITVFVNGFGIGEYCGYMFWIRNRTRGCSSSCADLAPFSRQAP